MAAVPRISEEERATRREQILDAAMRCVAREGFHKTSMAHVIRESGLSAGAVYGYFRSKEEIIGAVADRAMDIVGPAIEKAISQSPAPRPTEIIHLVTHAIVRQTEEAEVDITRVAVSAWAEAARDEAVRATAAEKIGGFRSLYADVLRRGQEAGDVDPAVDAEHAAQALFAFMPGFMLQRLIFDDITPETYVEGIKALGVR